MNGFRALQRAGQVCLAAGFLALIGGLGRAEAHAPYVVYNGTIQSWGANAVHQNWYNGWQRPDPNTKTVAVVDDYGLSFGIKGSVYYPDSAWNQYDNPHTWVVKDVAPVDGGTAIYIYPLDPTDPQQLTHIHLRTWDQYGRWVESNDLMAGPAYVGDLHLSSGTVASGDDSAATVISHEVGHALGLEDEDYAHDTIMISPNPGIRWPSTDDRRTEEVCITNYPWNFPC